MTVTYTVRRTNPLSRYPYRIVRTIRPTQGIERIHKLLPKFDSHDSAQRFLDKYIAGDLIDRLT